MNILLLLGAPLQDLTCPIIPKVPLLRNLFTSTIPRVIRRKCRICIRFFNIFKSSVVQVLHSSSKFHHTIPKIYAAFIPSRQLSSRIHLADRKIRMVRGWIGGFYGLPDYTPIVLGIIRLTKFGWPHDWTHHHIKLVSRWLSCRIWKGNTAASDVTFCDTHSKFVICSICRTFLSRPPGCSILPTFCFQNFLTVFRGTFIHMSKA